MSRFLKYCLALMLVLGCSQTSRAFTFWGEYDFWQEFRIGYDLPGDYAGPMNLEEEYRWNTPIITYGFDESFINYFGTNGVTAVEQAIQIMNDLPRFSEITPDMLKPETSAFPPIVHAENYSASAMTVADVKSGALHFLIEAMGLDSPERYVYTLRSRTPEENITNWVVFQRNFDPVTHEPTNRINDVYYYYDGIVETKIGGNPVDFPVVRQVTLEPNAGTVADGKIIGRPGFYYPGTNAATALTRDDVGGLSYLYHPTNRNVEVLPVGTEEIFTNTLNPVVLTNYDIGLLIQETVATTNTAADVLAKFPGLLITGTNSYLSNVVTTNISSYFTNYPYNPFEPEPLVQIFTTNLVTTAVQYYDYTVGNVVTNSFGSGRIVTDRTYSVTLAGEYTPGGSRFVTNIISEATYFTNLPNGSFYIVPTNILEFIVATNLAIPMEVSKTNFIAATTIDSVPFVDSLIPPLLVTTLDYHALYTNSVRTTNTVTQLKAIPGYEDLLVLQTNGYAGTIITTNIITYFKNYPWAPEQVFETNYTTNAVTFYDYTIGNIVVDPYFPAEIGRPMTVRTVEIVPAEDYTPGLGGIRTNLLESYTDTQHVENGEFLIFEVTNSASGNPLLGYTNARLIKTEVTATTNIDNFIFANFALRTNTSSNVLVKTTDLTTFSEQARTNTPEAFKALYPKLLILSATPYYPLEVTTNFISFFTNAPYSPAGSLSITQQPYYETNVVTNWMYTFGNVVTNFGSTDPISTNGLLIIEENIMGYNPFAPAGSDPVTNTTVTATNWNVPVGNIYIVDTNFFGYSFNELLLTKVVPITNTLVITNIVSNFGIEQTNIVHYIRYETNYFLDAYAIELLGTNDLLTNIFGVQREFITYATNRTFEVRPIDLLSLSQFTNQFFGEKQERVFFYTNSLVTVFPVQTRPPLYDVALRPGVDKIQFVRLDYDSSTGTNRLNYTNSYIDTVIIDDEVVQQHVRRVITRPDILFSAADLGTISGQPVFFSRTNTFRNLDAINGSANLAGPGIIEPVSIISFSKVGPYYQNYNQGSGFFQSPTPLYRWGSFDSTTNIIVYPVGTSIEDVGQQVLIP